jgi:hypothetical protein
MERKAQVFPKDWAWYPHTCEAKGQFPYQSEPAPTAHQARWIVIG